MGLSRSKQQKPTQQSFPSQPGFPTQPGFQGQQGFPAQVPPQVQPGFPQVQQQFPQSGFPVQPGFPMPVQQPGFVVPQQGFQQSIPTNQPFPALPSQPVHPGFASPFPGTIFPQASSPSYPVSYSNQVFNRTLVPGYQANDQRRSNVLTQEQDQTEYATRYYADQQLAQMPQMPQMHVSKARKH